MSQLNLFERDRLIVSVFDASTEWPAPYIADGYPVLAWDYKHEGCLLQHYDRLLMAIDEAIEAGYHPHGLLLAPPCTDFSSAGAQFWPRKDSTPAPEPYGPWTLTQYSEALVTLALDLAQRYPWAFWALENPPGRLERLVPEVGTRRLVFQPYHFGDAHTKKTILYGRFNPELRRREVVPELVEIKAGGTTRPRTYKASPHWKKTGSGEKSRALRSQTPAGFATAFYHANP